MGRFFKNRLGTVRVKIIQDVHKIDVGVIGRIVMVEIFRVLCGIINKKLTAK